MTAPERIWVCPDLIVPQDKELRVIEGAEKIPDWTCGTFWEGDPPDYPHGQMYHHADTVTALQAEVDRLREALERLSTAGCMGDGRALGIHLPTHPVGQEIWARMQYAKAALSGDDA